MINENLDTRASALDPVSVVENRLQRVYPNSGPGVLTFSQSDLWHKVSENLSFRLIVPFFAMLAHGENKADLDHFGTSTVVRFATPGRNRTVIR